MTRDKSRILERGEWALGRGDVGDDHVRARCVEHLPHDGRSRADRNGDDDERRVRDRLGERRSLLDRAARRSAPERPWIGVETATPGTRAAGGKRDGRPDETGADDGEALDGALPFGP